MSNASPGVSMPSDNTNDGTNVIKREYIQPSGIIAIRKGGKLDPMTMTIPKEEARVRKTNWMTWERLAVSGIANRLQYQLTLANT
jgi:hypothetical protein